MKSTEMHWFQRSLGAAAADFKRPTPDLVMSHEYGKPKGIPENSTSGQPTGRTGTEIPFSLNRLQDVYGSNVDDIARILRLFVRLVEPLFNSIDQALSLRTSTRLQEAAHKLKGSSATVGAENLATLALQMETAVKEENWEAVHRLYSAALVIFEKVIEFVDRFETDGNHYLGDLE